MNIRNQYRTVKKSLTKTVRIPAGASLSTEAIFDAEYGVFKIFCADVTGIPALSTIQPRVGGQAVYSHNGDIISLDKPADGFTWSVVKFGTSRMRIKLDNVTTDEVVFSITAYDFIEGVPVKVSLGQPEIEVTGTVDFGSTPQNTAVDEIFTITNNGDKDLIIELPIVVPADFSVTVDPTETLLLPGESTTFTIEADALVLGTHTGDVEISNNSSVNPYVFEITVEVV